MTNDEAIIDLSVLAERMDSKNAEIPVYDISLEAVDMAIKALEQEPCDDAISRQAALDAFGLSEKTRKYGGDHSGYDTMMLYEIQQTLEDLPTVTPKQRTGHWEWVQYDYNPKLGNWHCSECRCIVVECANKEEKGGIPLYKYCPQCGTKMIEPQESEEI